MGWGGCGECGSEGVGWEVQLSWFLHDINIHNRSNAVSLTRCFHTLIDGRLHCEPL